MRVSFRDNIEETLSAEEIAFRRDAALIIEEAIQRVQPGPAVRAAFREMFFKHEDSGCQEQETTGRTILIAAGKAAWEMAQAAYEAYPGRIDEGLVVTKYGHSRGPIQAGNPEIIESGHPVPDENSVRAAEKALKMVSGLTAEDRVLFLLSGGGSALFESPLVPLPELQDITDQLLASGADIVSINTIRKRLSKVKGGRFALAAMPAQVYTVVLSDIVGDPLDMIASGPACPDSSTAADAEEIVRRFRLKLSSEAQQLLKEETPKELRNVTTFVTGSVRELVRAASETASRLGCEPVILTESLTMEAREAGRWLGKLAREYLYRNPAQDPLSWSCGSENQKFKIPERAFKNGDGGCPEKNSGEHKGIVLLAGGETVVHLNEAPKENGKGGRNQELALAAAMEIAGREDVCIFSFGSDGTDGPTDAAGGIVSGKTAERIRRAGMDPEQVLEEHNSYPALFSAGGLIMTGPTGTNVNDLAAVLIRG